MEMKAAFSWGSNQEKNELNSPVTPRKREDVSLTQIMQRMNQLLPACCGQVNTTPCCSGILYWKMFPCP